MKITVLAGGESNEREVSFASGQGVIRCLLDSGHDAQGMDPAAGWSVFGAGAALDSLPKPSLLCGLPPAESIDILRTSDIVLNVLHGGQGENGQVNSVLELLGVTYAGSPPKAGAIAMDKIASKRLFLAAGVPTPEFIEFDSGNYRDAEKILLEKLDYLGGFPLIVKPVEEGSTIGLTKVKKLAEAVEGVALAMKYGGRAMVERFIAGRELTVAVLGDSALPVIEIIAESGLYDYTAKYGSDTTKYICPAEISNSEREISQHYALKAFKVLGLRDYSRIDFRLDSESKPWCIEANNQPGMTAHSLLPKAARAAGLEMDQLLMRIIELASNR